MARCDLVAIETTGGRLLLKVRRRTGTSRWRVWCVRCVCVWCVCALSNSTISKQTKLQFYNECLQICDRFWRVCESCCGWWWWCDVMMSIWWWWCMNRILRLLRTRSISANEWKEQQKKCAINFDLISIKKKICKFRWPAAVSCSNRLWLSREKKLEKEKQIGKQHFCKIRHWIESKTLHSWLLELLTKSDLIIVRKKRWWWWWWRCCCNLLTKSLLNLLINLNKLVERRHTHWTGAN